MLVTVSGPHKLPHGHTPKDAAPLYSESSRGVVMSQVAMSRAPARQTPQQRRRDQTAAAVHGAPDDRYPVSSVPSCATGHPRAKAEDVGRLLLPTLHTPGRGSRQSWMS